MTLAELAVGEQGCVAEVQGNDEIAVRILEMGLIPGTEVSVLGTAPWGDPLELDVRGYRLSLRKAEAARVILRPSPQPSPEGRGS